MREALAELEKLLVLAHKGVSEEVAFLSGLLDHKNATIAWFRERQKEDIDELTSVYNKLQESFGALTETVNRQYEDITGTLMKEVELLENHLSSYEKKEPLE